MKKMPGQDMEKKGETEIFFKNTTIKTFYVFATLEYETGILWDQRKSSAFFPSDKLGENCMSACSPYRIFFLFSGEEEEGGEGTES